MIRSRGIALSDRFWIPARDGKKMEELVRAPPERDMTMEGYWK